MTHAYGIIKTGLMSCLPVALFIMLFNYADAQIDSCAIVACNDDVELRVKKGESYPTTPELFLEGVICAHRTYLISYMDARGNTYDFKEVHDALPPQFTYVVEESLSGNRCWGRVRLKVLNCNQPFDPEWAHLNTEINCFEDISPESLGFPTPPDQDPQPDSTQSDQYVISDWSPCGDVILSYNDKITNFDCTQPFRAIIHRTWTITDEGKLDETVKDTISLKRASLDQVIELPNFDGIEGPVLDCSDDWNTGDDIPSPEVTGQPLVHETCDLYGSSYSDQIFILSSDSCYTRKKIIRTWKIIDWCLMDIREFDQTIFMECSKDVMSPVVICRSGLRVQLDPTGIFNLFPEDIDEGSYDDCGIARLSFDSAGNIGVITFNKSDVGKRHVVQLFATDHGGRQNSCWSQVEVIGNSGQTGNIGGRFFNYNLEPIDFKEKLQFTASDASRVITVQTCALPGDPDDLGYAVCFNPAGFRPPYHIDAEVLDPKPQEGLSTIDVVLLMKSLISRGSKNPFLQIAADVNGSQSITAADVALLRAVVLGQQSLDIEPWQFWHADSTNLQRIVDLDINSLPFYDADVVPVRIGDLNNDLLTGGLKSGNSTRSGEEMVMYYHDKEIHRGEAFDIWLRTDDRRPFVALQLAQYFDESGLEVISVSSNIPEASEHWAGYNNEWRYILIDPLLQPLTLDQEWLQISFLASEDGMASDFISNDEFPFSLLAVDEALQEVPIRLEVKDATTTNNISGHREIGIYPNPFSQEAIIDLSGLGNESGTFKIYSTSGRLIFQTSLEDLSQSGQLVVDRNILKTNGLFIGVAETSTDRHVVKINKL